MNALADPEVIKALYRASQAGVQIDLLVRGVCALRPGVPKLSERIRVKSVVDRFLEHARIWHFHARGEKKVYLASGDWMPRNFIRRVDVAFPVESALLKERILSEILGTMLADDVKTRALRPDGTYERVRPRTQGSGEGPLRSQEHFLALARRAAFADASRSPAVAPGRPLRLQGSPAVRESSAPSSAPRAWRRRSRPSQRPPPRGGRARTPRRRSLPSRRQSPRRRTT